MPTQCKSCNGIYEKTQRDGTLYFHACAPVANPAYQPDPTKPNFDTVETIERAQKRDENIDDSPAAATAAGRDKNPNAPLPIKAAGRGTQ